MSIPTPGNWCPPDAGPSQTETARRSPSALYPERDSFLCSRRWRRLYLTGVIRDLLIRQFSNAAYIEEQDLRRYIWQNSVTTEILIESIYLWRGDLVEKRPALIIKPGARKNYRVGIGDILGPDRVGHVQYQTYWIGSHTVFAIHGSGAGAEILADETQRQLTEYGPALLEAPFGLTRWVVAEVGEIAVLEEAKQNFVIPINVTWCFEESWRLERESMKLAKFQLDLQPR